MPTPATPEAHISPRDRDALTRLAIFPGSFTLDAAREVVGDHPIETPGSNMWGRAPSHFPPSEWSLEAAAALRALEARGLVERRDDQPGVPRWGVPESIRTNLLSAMTPSELAALRRRHALATLAFVEAVEIRLWGVDYARYMPHLAADAPSLAAALAWADETGETEIGLRLATALWLVWQTRGRVAAGRHWLARFLDDRGQAPDLRAAGLTVASLLAWMQHDLDAADAMLAEALPLWRELGFIYGIGRALLFKGFVAWRRENGRGMIEACEEACQYFREGNDLAGLPLSLIVLAVADHRSDNDARAMARLDEAAELADLGGFAWGGAAARYYLGEIRASRGELPDAASAYHASLTVSWRLGDPWTTGAGIGGVATVAAMRGEATAAARLFGAADALCASAEALLPVMDRGDFARVVAAARATMGEKAFARAYAAGAALSPEAAITEAETALQSVAGGAKPNGVAPTARELDVLRLVVEGQSDDEIAYALNLSPRTIEGHLTNLRRKFSVPGRTALAVLAIRRNLV